MGKLPNDWSVQCGERLRKVRELKKWSQECLAIEAEKHFQRVTMQFNEGHSLERSISKYERGEVEPGSIALYALSEALNVSTDYLLCKSDEMNPGLREMSDAIDHETMKLSDAALSFVRKMCHDDWQDNTYFIYEGYRAKLLDALLCNQTFFDALERLNSAVSYQAFADKPLTPVVDSAVSVIEESKRKLSNHRPVNTSTKKVVTDGKRMSALLTYEASEKLLECLRETVETVAGQETKK